MHICELTTIWNDAALKSFFQSTVDLSSFSWLEDFQLLLLKFLGRVYSVIHTIYITAVALKLEGKKFFFIIHHRDSGFRHIFVPSNKVIWNVCELFSIPSKCTASGDCKDRTHFFGGGYKLFKKIYDNLWIIKSPFVQFFNNNYFEKNAKKVSLL